MRRFTCGVPAKHCGGSSPILSFSIRTNILKCHGSPEQAFRCHARWLTQVEGYTRLGPREFTKGESSPVLVLTKKSKFGGVLRQGKHESGKSNAKRVMPTNRGGGLISSY